MKYRKTKISLSVISILIVVTCILLIKPTEFESISSSGKIIQCERASVTVPEVRNDAESNQIEIEFVRLKSFSDNPLTPIFYLSGGPGQDATSQAEHPQHLEYWSAFLKTRDVILIDQRGVGKLNMLWINKGWPPDGIFVSEDVAVTHFLDMGKKAVKAFERRGIDLNGYNSIESAQDIDAVRDLLGYEKIIPFGFSYGTHLGQAYIKYHEDRVERSVLIGVEGLGHNFKMPSDLDNHFLKIADIVNADKSINKTIPDFVGLYHLAAQRLERKPVEIEIVTPILLKRKVVIGKFGLDYILKRDLGDANDIPYFPRLLHNIAYGDGSALEWYVEKRFKEFMAIPGMMASMDLSSGGSTERIAKVREEEAQSMFGKVANFPFMDMHTQWPVKDLGETFRTFAQSELPVLLLSGSLDINTPAYQAEKVKSGFPNGTHLVVANAGHEQIKHHDYMTPTILAFLKGEDVSEVELSYPNIRFKSIKKIDED